MIHCNPGNGTIKLVLYKSVSESLPLSKIAFLPGALICVCDVITGRFYFRDVLCRDVARALLGYSNSILSLGVYDAHPPIPMTRSVMYTWFSSRRVYNNHSSQPSVILS